MSGPRREPVLTVESLAVTRGKGRTAHRVVEGFSVSIAAGEIVGLSGTSGSGKSSVLSTLSGELLASAGTIHLRSDAASGSPRYVRQTRPGAIGLVAQDPMATLDSLWTIADIIAEPLRAMASSRVEIDAATDAMLHAVGLGGLPRRRVPGQLSIGQAQRVCIARALAGRPSLVVADEPTSALDVVNAARVVALLREAARRGAAVVLASHDIGLLDKVSDRRLHLEEGRIEAVTRRSLVWNESPDSRATLSRSGGVVGGQ